LEAGPDNFAAERQNAGERPVKGGFPEVAKALHAAVPGTVRGWRTRSLEAMAYLADLPEAGLENSISSTLHLLADALENDDPALLLRLLEQSHADGLLRFRQHCDPETMLTEERIIRAVVVVELGHELRRSPTADEAAALHDLLDRAGQRRLLVLIQMRSEEHDQMVRLRVTGMHRLADLGMLVAGVAHDAANLILPLRMRLNSLKGGALAPKTEDDLNAIELLVKQFQNSIVNLRWLSADAAGGASSTSRSRPAVSLRLREWADEAVAFHARMLPPQIVLETEIAPGLPPVTISSAALSQAVFNLVHNASQAIASTGEGAAGRIVLRATARGDDAVEFTVEDDGPGMSEEVLRRSSEPFYTTRANGSGLGLSLVQALLTGCGGSMRCCSPPPTKARGTAVVLTLPIAKAV
jgi:signal transduction histidine kinase